ncbi:MAG: hypothetical protein HND43_03930 [Armatimonadetes bacterium]|uniref:Uncharacterized protein n=1 Tax=Candidatus Nitrosymbiomonas proteolyticus TaxID=2608984 RepID=A0A809S513_9BACT|nr:hypothetical protein [Armatimonadota bacterium]NOG38525.1 hypothetical protein [Armatimonadota bacterium]BBO23886.1 conserved hypothetical protein [Candidatus Nitrosymbiomonas proteolyticus]GIK32140.1 MAG: hypothetical protein BroJett009_11320 [Armatimonadota bacterium]
MASNAAVDELISLLRRRYGAYQQIGRSSLFCFGSKFTCSINYSKLLGSHKYFFGVSRSLLTHQDACTDSLGTYVLLICGSADNVLVLPRDLVERMLEDVSSRRVDVFIEGGMFILQTTRHPKLDVTGYLNAYPAASTAPDESELEPSPIPPRTHVRMQHALISLGRAEGCTVWVPPNDRSLSFEGQRFANATMDRLPRFGFDENTRRIVQNIDVLWLQESVIVKAVEIESTTSIYSGLLRLNDLVLAQPNNQVDLVIAAPQSRRQRVFEQLIRPSFRPLISRCGFLSFEVVDEAIRRLVALGSSSNARVSGLLTVEGFELPEHVVYPADTR